MSANDMGGGIGLCYCGGCGLVVVGAGLGVGAEAEGCRGTLTAGWAGWAVGLPSWTVNGRLVGRSL